MKPRLIIEELTDMATSEAMAFYSKGHHDFADFKQAVADEQGITLDEVGDPQHEWWRWMPAPKWSDCDVQMQPAKTGERGAFPVTVVWCTL